MRICFGLILRVLFAKVHKAKSGCFGRSNRLEVIKALRRGRGNDVCDSASVDVILVLPFLFFALLVGPRFCILGFMSDYTLSIFSINLFTQSTASDTFGKSDDLSRTVSNAAL